MGKQIEKSIELEHWEEARALIRSELKRHAGDHWLLTRLGLTYYEQRQYKRALRYTEKALAIAPNCPLVLWDYATSLDMLEHREEAISIYLRIIKRGINRIANGECGEGKAWARGLVADCHYRLAHCYRDLSQHENAIKEYKRHLSLRGPGCRSIYHIDKVRKELRNIDRAEGDRNAQKTVDLQRRGA